MTCVPVLASILVEQKLEIPVWIQGPQLGELGSQYLAIARSVTFSPSIGASIILVQRSAALVRAAPIDPGGSVTAPLSTDNAR